jgi:DNA helicase-2/ATP-dependent DNA helicase PcrA
VIDKPENLSTRAISALRSFRRIILRLAALAGTSIETAPAPPGTAGVSPASASASEPIASGSASDRGSSPTVREGASASPTAREGSAVSVIDSSSPVSDIVKAAILDTGYEYALKGEKTDEAEARLENLQELVNAAVDYDEQGLEGLRDFIDHSALVSDTDQYKGDAPVTLMTAHSAKGLEFPLVFIVGLEDGLFPHSRSATDPAELEEERRLCYVAMTRAERLLYVTHAMKRRVYGEELASEPSQFLNEMPLDLMEDLSRGNSWLSFARGSSAIDYEHGEYRRSAHVSTGTAGVSPAMSAKGANRASGSERGSSPTVREGSRGPSDRGSARKDNTNYTGKTYDSVDSIAEFFKQRATQLGNTGGSFESTRERAEREKSNRRQAERPKSNVQRPTSHAQRPDSAAGDSARGSSSTARKGSGSQPETRNSKLETGPSDFVPGSYVRHAKYGRGLVLRREGVGESSKLTVTFPGYGQKKLIEKYAGLEKG